MLACMHVEVKMCERKLTRRRNETRKNTWGKMIDKATKESYEKYFASCNSLGSID